MPEDFVREHEQVFTEALGIFITRGKVRGQMWLDTTIERELDMIEEKLTRARAAFGDPGSAFTIDDPDMMKEYEDSLLDLINFANFAIKKARRGLRA